MGCANNARTKKTTHHVTADRLPDFGEVAAEIVKRLPG
jgi:hypothetical protein